MLAMLTVSKSIAEKYECIFLIKITLSYVIYPKQQQMQIIFNLIIILF